MFFSWISRAVSFFFWGGFWLSCLLCRYDSLRIAYVDTVKEMKDGRIASMTYYSKLIKADPSGGNQVWGRKKKNTEIWKHTFSFWQIGCFCILYFSVTLWTHITYSNRVLGVVGGLFLLQEIYSIKLPGKVFLGEGKAENQNHAIIFTRGDALQKIDMNQVHFPWFCTLFYLHHPPSFLKTQKEEK